MSLSPLPSKLRGPFAALFATAWGLFALNPVASAQTQSPAGPAPAQGQTPSAMDTLIGRLVQRGVLSAQDGAELTAQADADAADTRVKQAEAALAVAQAEAAVARARAAEVQAAEAQDRVRAAAGAILQSAAAQQTAAQALLGQLAAPGQTQATASARPAAPAVRPTESVPMPPAAPAEPAVPEAPVAVAPPPPEPAQPAPVAAPPPPPAAPASVSVEPPPAAPAVPMPQPVASASESSPPTPVTSTDANGVSATVVPTATQQDNAPVTVVPMNSGEAPTTIEQAPEAPQASPPAPSTSTAPAEAPVAETPAAAAPAAAAADSSAAAVSAPPPEEVAGSSAPDASDGTVRVAYVPDVVKNEIRQEVDADVLAEARKEHWAGAEKVPDWVSRITIYGDIRVREEEIINHNTNDTTFGSFPNFNAINTASSPIDYAAVQAGTAALPQYNVNQNRNRLRFRTRVGFAVDLKNGFTAGIRVASGNDDNPVTENQTMGAAGATGQGGYFDKYDAWLDQAFIKYQGGGDPTRDISLTMGRFDNPFFSTPMMWANDLGFDGVALRIPAKVHIGGAVADNVKPFIVGGAFPIFNTDLNFGTDNSVKDPSYDKWLYAGQAGFDWKVNDDFSWKSAVALYDFHNIEGKLSTPFTPVLITDSGNTDASRPSFAQNGNTYMLLRDIVPAASNNFGTTDQWQWFGLATPFRDLVLTDRVSYDHFDPFEISLTGEFARNLAFTYNSVAAIAVNNYAIASDGSAGAYAGGNKAWFTNLQIGDAVLDKGGAWNVSLGYRYVETDSIVDAFTDADFGGVLLGTNLKGTTLEARVALAPGVWLQGRWMSATAIVGPTYKNDLIQFDINGKF